MQAGVGMSLLFVVDDRYVHLYGFPEKELDVWVPRAACRTGTRAPRIQFTPGECRPHGAGASTPAVVASGGDGRASTLPGAGAPDPVPGNFHGRSS